MKWQNKVFRIYGKLYLRSLKRSPRTIVLTFLSVSSIMLSLYVVFDRWYFKNHNFDSTFSYWQQINKENEKQRGIASVDHQSFDLNALKQEIIILENRMNVKHYTEGQWKGLDLKKLSHQQVKYITEQGPYIGEVGKSYDFSSCADVPCVLNQVYNDSNAEMGYLAYYWYLKTGIALSHSNILPQIKNEPGVINGKSYEFNEYLFSKDELYKFVNLARSLPNIFLYNPLIKSIHKVPGFEIVKQNECGASFPTGQILLNQNCLSDNQNPSVFYVNVPHHLSYYVDQVQGLKEKTSFYSESEKWLQLSKWTREDFWDDKTQVYRSKWNSGIKSPFYSPQEQFAKALSMYRYSPSQFSDHFSKEIEDHLKENFFDNKNYSPKGIFESYLSKSIQLWSQKEHAYWQHCFKNHLTPEVMTKSDRNLASLSMTNPLFSCVENESKNFVEYSVDYLIKNDFDGQNFFNQPNYNEFASQYKIILERFINEKIVQMKLNLQNKGVQVLSAQKIKEHFLHQFDPSNLLIKCYHSKDEKSCYESQLSSYLSKYLKREKININQDYKVEILNDLKLIVNFYDAKELTNQVVKEYLQPIYSKVDFKMNETWEKCKSEGANHSYYLTSNLQFSGGVHYVDAKFLNCINDHLDTSVKSVVYEAIFRKINNVDIAFVLKSREAKVLYPIVKKDFLNKLKIQLNNDVQMEKKFLENYFNSGKDEIINSLANNKTILNDTYSIDHLTNKCMDRVLSMYPKDIHYYTPMEVDHKYGRKICSILTNDPKWLNQINNKIASEWNDSKEQFEETFADTYKKEVKNCNKQYPLDMGPSFVKNSRLRKICIEESYDISLKTAIEEWREDDSSEHFSEREDELRREMYSKKSQLVSQAIGEDKTKI